MKTADTAIFRFLLFFLFVNCCTLLGTTRFHNALFNPLCDPSDITLFAPSAAGKSIILGAPVTGMEESSLILLDGTKQIYRGIAEKKIMVNSKQNSDSPLYNKQIALLTTQPLGSDPIVVTADAPARLCLARNAHSAANYNVLTLENIKDSNNESCGKIVALAAMPNHYIFAAVTGKDTDSFGDKGSGIALVQIKETRQENESAIFTLTQIDTLKPNKLVEEQNEAADQDKDQSTQTKNKSEKKEAASESESKDEVDSLIHAIPLDRSSAAIKINHDLAEIDIRDMVWDCKLGVMYVALHVKSADQADAGAQAIAVIKYAKSGEWMVEPFAPATIFSSEKENNIFSVMGANKEITAHKICAIRNSAELPYLIVLGGNSTPEQTNRTVYAFPIFAKKSKDEIDPAYGRMAKRGSTIKITKPFVKHPTAHYKFFDQNATTQEDLFVAEDAAVQVGRGALKEGPITSIIAHHDLVYATVSSADEGCLPGLFVSRALMDEAGVIVSWTAWQRTSGITDAVLGATAQDNDGSIVFYCKDNETESIAAKQTSWAKDTHTPSHLENIINTQFAQGIVDMINFHADSATNKAPHLAIVGNNKIALVKTGYIHNDTVIPFKDTIFTPAIECANGSIDKEINKDDSIVIIGGGALQDIAPLTSAALVSNGIEEWILVGGAKGLAVLTDKQGAGFVRNSNNDSIIAALQKDMSFKKISSCRFVCKIIGDRSRAYVLTNRGLERIDLTAAPFATSAVQSTTLASSTHLLKEQGCFFDMLISEKLAIVATSAGLVRIANDKDIASITSEQDAQWLYLPLPEQMGATLQFDIQSSTGKPEDISRGNGGMFYVLDSAYGKNRSRIHRLIVKNTEGDIQVNDTTVTVSLDIFPGKNNSSHVTLSSSRKKIVTDGALLLSFPTSNKNKPGIVSGGTMRGHVNNIIALPVETGEVESLVRESASGRWFIGGSFGLLIHE